MKEKILILGGTEFVGRLVVEALAEDETKEVYLFNRGKTNPDLFPQVQRILGDRETDDIKQIQSYKWDYVIDFSSYYPKSLQKTLDQINRDVKKYIYISTISVYSFEGYDSSFKIDEDFQKLECSATEAIDKTMKTYGKKKAACEEILKNTSWLNAVMLRPSVIYGKYDPTDRFYYWLRKLKTSKEIIIPNTGEDQLSLTYADDLVDIILNTISNDLPSGAYNCNTHEPLSFRSMLEIMKELLGSNSKLYGIDTDKLKEKEVWLPLSFISNLKFDNSSIKHSLQMEFTSFYDSVKAVIKYYEEKDWPACSIGVTEEKEKAIIKREKPTVSND
jgi:nucleoside-diphosphate-sugar epimerase